MKLCSILLCSKWGDVGATVLEDNELNLFGIYSDRSTKMGMESRVTLMICVVFWNYFARFPVPFRKAYLHFIHWKACKCHSNYVHGKVVHLLFLSIFFAWVPLEMQNSNCEWEKGGLSLDSMWRRIQIEIIPSRINQNWVQMIFLFSQLKTSSIHYCFFWVIEIGIRLELELSPDIDLFGWKGSKKFPFFWFKFNSNL